MGWKPEHGGIEEILRTKQFPSTRCMDYYDEQLDRHITGMKQRERVMQEMGLQEAGDKVHGFRNEEVALPKGTLFFDIPETPSSQKAKEKNDG